MNVPPNPRFFVPEEAASADPSVSALQEADLTAFSEFKRTAEYGLIEHHRGQINVVRREIEIATGGAMLNEPPSVEEKQAWAAKDFTALGMLKQAKAHKLGEYLHENQIPIDIATLIATSEVNPISLHDPRVKHATATLDICDNRLQKMSEALPTLPHLRRGNQLTIQRNPDNEHPEPYFEPDWAMGNIRADGTIVAHKLDMSAFKAVSLENLVAWNPIEQLPTEQ